MLSSITTTKTEPLAKPGPATQAWRAQGSGFIHPGKPHIARQHKPQNLNHAQHHQTKHKTPNLNNQTLLLWCPAVPTRQKLGFSKHL